MKMLHGFIALTFTVALCSSSSITCNEYDIRFRRPGENNEFYCRDICTKQFQHYEKVCLADQDVMDNCGAYVECMQGLETSTISPAHKDCIQDLETMKEKLETMKENMTEKLDSMKEKLETMKENMTEKLETMKEKLETTKENMKEKLETMRENMTEKLDSMKEKLETMKENMTEKLETMKEKLETTKENMKEKLKAAYIGLSLVIVTLLVIIGAIVWQLLKQRHLKNPHERNKLHNGLQPAPEDAVSLTSSA